MFIAALLTITKTWKQPKCSFTDIWVKKMWCVYTVRCYSAIKKKNEMMPFVVIWMDLEIIMGFPGGSDGKESAHNVVDLGLILVWEDSLEKERLPTPVFLPG